MSTPQFFYLVTVVIYIAIFFLFLRYLWWKKWADKRYWHKRMELSQERLLHTAKRHDRELPFFSVMVPARNEADVIANTIEHMASLNYPVDRYEIIIITDEKELLALNAGAASGPTTQDVVDAKIAEFEQRDGTPALKHQIVPFDFDGRLHGRCLGWEVPSTKGRALNFGLAFIDSRTEICGFYDAESRPTSEVLQYIAYRHIISEGKVRLWQGPVFQVRNFFQLSPINKVAAIYQAVAHEWYLPILMKQLPFAGGTNLFVNSALLEEVGGYDHQALTEDLELGVRSYIEADAWPEYFPYPSTEQTPPTYQTYFRQRLRWGSGHLQVTDKFRNAEYDHADKAVKQEAMVRALFWKGQAEWILYQSAVLIPLLLLPFALAGFLDPTILPLKYRQVMNLSAPIYFAFTFSRFQHFSPYIDFGLAPRGLWHRAMAIGQLVVLPMAGVFLPLPFTFAVVLKALHRQPLVWVKTPRTKELSRQLTR